MSIFVLDNPFLSCILLYLNMVKLKKKVQLKAQSKVQPEVTGITKKGKPFRLEMKERLLKDREGLLSEVTRKVRTESDTLKFEIGDIYDIASSERERELSLILGDRDREKLAEIDDALERLNDGTYGICEECGEPIGEGRLRAMPFTRVCVECKSKNEKERGARRRYEEEAGLGILERAEGEEEEF